MRIQKDEYLRKLSWALDALPEDSRNEIVAETRAHIEERLETGNELQEVLTAFGDPLVYAQSFLDEYKVTTAISEGATSGLVTNLFDRVFSNRWFMLNSLLCILLWCLTIIVCVVALLKLVDPSTVGLWQTDGFFIFGIIDRPDSGKELLGLWLFPIAILAVMVSWFCTRWLAIFALKKYLATQK